eukprot:1136697-Pelagomonas_calceolata.AAC.4
MGAEDGWRGAGAYMHGFRRGTFLFLKRSTPCSFKHCACHQYIAQLLLPLCPQCMASSGSINKSVL